MTAPVLDLDQKPTPTFDLTGPEQEILQELDARQYEHLREKARTDLFFLSKGILGYDQVELGAHGALCKFMVEERSNRRMVLMPRGHLKSTICTISDSIRLSLIDPNIRILIQNEVLENACNFLDELKNHWKDGKLLRWLFPELVPEKFQGPNADWSINRASIVRDTKAKEATYMASGSGGSPQSMHFNRLKNDDLVGERQRNSSVEMARSIRWIDAMTPLLDRLDDQIDFYGTRKSMADAYAHVMEKYRSILKVFIRLPIEDDKPIFSKFPMEELLRIMTDTPDVWAYDYLNNPVGKGGLDWGKGLLRQFSIGSDRRIWFEDHLSGKPSGWHLSELDIVITVDPNKGKATSPDKAAVVVTGTSPTDQLFVLSSKSGRWSPDDLINTVWDDAAQWRPRLIGFEDAGQQNTHYYFEKKMREEQLYYMTKELTRDNKQNKETRIRSALDTPMKARRVYVQAGMLGLIGQIQLFPSLADHNWDEIDCLSFITEVGQRGFSKEEQAAEAEAEHKILHLRDLGRTGYGRSV